MAGVHRLALFAAIFLVATMLMPDSAARPCQKQKQSKLMRYLIKYGYLEPGYEGSKHPEKEKAVQRAVKKLQRYRRLNENGEMSDVDTLKLVEAPRCSLKDVDSDTELRRKRRYAVHGTVWNVTDLTYKFNSYTPDLSKDKVRATLKKALAMWAAASPLTFTEVAEPETDAHIQLDFVRGEHGDGRPADGPGKELAHAFFPLDNEGLAGDVHFDEDESYTVDDPTNSGVDLLWLSVHELGHSLGLRHSYDFGSVMYPFYLGYAPDLKLNQDDISGIQSLYGMPGAERETPTLPSNRGTSPNVPRKCNITFDAIVTTKDKTTFVFSGESLWEIGESGAGEEKNIWEVFSQLEPNIDAAYTRQYGQTFFFKGSRVWIYEDTTLIRGPVDIAEINLPSTLHDMDAALEWAGNGKTYFFKGELYWRFDPIRQEIDAGYPKPIVPIWRGIPNHLHAALQWVNGRSYFFKGKDFYAFDDLRARARPYHPKSLATEWMGCGAQGL